MLALRRFELLSRGEAERDGTSHRSGLELLGLIRGVDRSLRVLTIT